MALLPDAALEFLGRADRSGRLAHAYLIAGESGSGKRTLALRLAALVGNPNGQAVHGVAAGDPESVLKHPDVHTVEPESKSRIIRVEQTRALEKELQMRSSLGGRKVGIIFDADRMNAAASNSFLKTLEEPPQNSLLMLVTAHPEMLLDTILSRCIFIQLAAAEHRELSEEQRNLLDLLGQFFEQPKVGIGEVFGLVRGFTVQLAAAKTRIQGEATREWKREESAYKQTADGKWLEEREEYFKVLGESRYLQIRARFVDTLLQWWGDVLRQQHGGTTLDFPAYAAKTQVLAGRFSTPEVLRRVSVLEGLRENFNRNVQEQLAIEVAFLGAFGS